MLNYKKLADQKPTIYETFTNSLGQVIEFVEHPTQGDCWPVIAICHELELAADTGFFETDDMIADHKEYEPTFQDGKLFLGDIEA